MDRADVIAAGDIPDIGFLEDPAYPNLTLPDFDRLFRAEVMAQAVPGLLGDVDHALNEVYEKLQ